MVGVHRSPWTSTATEKHPTEGFESKRHERYHGSVTLKREGEKAVSLYLGGRKRLGMRFFRKNLLTFAHKSAKISIPIIYRKNRIFHL